MTHTLTWKTFFATERRKGKPAGQIAAEWRAIKELQGTQSSCGAKKKSCCR